MVLDNAEEQFKDKTYGSGTILLREEPAAVVVPRSAVQAASDATFVFVRDKNFLSRQLTQGVSRAAGAHRRGR